MSVGMPGYVYLEQFGMLIRANFGMANVPYLVGSVLKKKTGWRDVDVRLLLYDEDWKNRGYGNPGSLNGRLLSDCAFYTEIGCRMTQLPIDFQIQHIDEANRLYGDLKQYPRSALGVIWRADE